MTEPARDEKTRRAVHLAIVVASLGYFVDIYDLILFSIVRLSSLRGLGVPESAALDKGAMLISMQMGGMLVGGILWGILGDKRGRLSVLFGSIALYSLANIANGFVTSVDQYAAMRLLAGIGLAGELGAGITLVSESMKTETRGYGTTIVASIGICGAVAAALVGDFFPWRTAYFIGGGLGVALLLLRIGVYESGMFEDLKKKSAVRRGDFLSLFATADRAKRYISVILVGVPIWYAVGILITFSKEIGLGMKMIEAPNPGRAVMFSYIGLAAGDFGSGALSQLLRSRKRVVLLFVSLTALAVVAYFGLGGRVSLAGFYAICVFLGFATGYWAVFVTIASEQFGTNIRATATTTAPNFVRGAVVPLTIAFKSMSDWLKGRASSPDEAARGVVWSALALGVFTLVVAFAAIRGLRETFGKGLDYVEE